MAEKPVRFTIWYFLAFMLLVLVFQTYVVGSRHVNITYSEFRRLVEMKAVDDLRIAGDSISGRLLPKGVEYLAKERQEPELPKRLQEKLEKEPVFSTTKLEDRDLVDRLDKQGITYRAVAEQTWLTNLLSWILPMLLLLAIWIYFFRKIGADAQATRGGQRAAAFGHRSEAPEVAPTDHADIYAPESPRPHSAIMQNYVANTLLGN